LLWGKAMAFCEDCGKRATCKQMCRELIEHLAHTCRAKCSPRAELRGDMVFIEETRRIKASWPRRAGDDAFGDPLPYPVDDPES